MVENQEDRLSSFANPPRHMGAAEIIRHYSTNRSDVRQAALDGLDLSATRLILDLGCGFGFMSETVARRCAPDAELIGLDACRRNEQPFLERMARTGRRARFVHQHVTTTLEWPDNHFDLVVASYTMYFFPGLVPAIARVLAPHGTLIALTHTEQSCHDLLRATGLPRDDARLLGLIHCFPAENGRELLSPWFAEIERVDYPNALVFEPEQYDDFLRYLRFKLPFLLSDPDSNGDGSSEPLANALRATLADTRRISFDKSDATFRCRRPLK